MTAVYVETDKDWENMQLCTKERLAYVVNVARLIK